MQGSALALSRNCDLRWSGAWAGRLLSGIRIGSRTSPWQPPTKHSPGGPNGTRHLPGPAGVDVGKPTFGLSELKCDAIELASGAIVLQADAIELVADAIGL